MAKKNASQTVYRCRDCRHAYDYHEKNLNGEYFMCKCPFQKRSMFLNRDVCERFEKKQ